MRVVRNIKRIIHQEMENLGGQEVLAPVVNPIDLWKSSGRDEMVGADMLRATDRNGRPLVIAPTHEEAMVELVRAAVRSYRDLPAFLYQFQTKFRDEEKTRCGLVRTREFLMKDAYSFHRTFSDLNNFFPRVFAAYRAIFARCGVPVIAAQAGVGYMGGELSYEFLMPARCGDDYLIRCDSCAYSANEDVAVGTKEIDQMPPEDLVSGRDDDAASLNAIRNALSYPRRRVVKAMLYRAQDRFVMAVVRGDHRVSEEKLGHVIHAPIVGRAEPDDLASLGLDGPWLSPIDLPQSARERTTVVVDDAVADSANLLAGANRAGQYYTNVNFGRDYSGDAIADVIRVSEGSRCTHCTGGTLQRERAMELGNIFRLGDYYTRRMQCTVADENGRSIYPQMGSYGIGVGRLLAAIVEANHDDRGIVWPQEVAPFSVFLMSIGRSLSVRRIVEEVYSRFDHTVLFDDRHASISRKMKDADLLGIPIRIVISTDAATDGTAEVAMRDGSATRSVALDELVDTVRAIKDARCLS
jgi:prolyl-tRNA synthetase